MLEARQAYDIGAPFVVASEELVCNAGRLRRGDAFPWRDLGFTEIDVRELWIALKIDCLDSPAPLAAPVATPATTVQLDEAPAPALHTDLESMTEAELERLTAPPPAPTPQPQPATGKRRDLD